MSNFIKRIWTPEVYHGYYKKHDFFEGWFFKLVSAQRDNILAIIPGVFKSRDKSKEHAFIQFLDARNHKSTYKKYSIDEFDTAEDRFEIKIGENSFSTDNISLKIDDRDFNVSGNLTFGQIKSWPKRLLSPGIMGWYSFVPFMECNHGIVSLDHSINGRIKINNNEIDFNNGRGYSEKDWGSSFPSSYVWIQSNHFSETGISLTASVAKIPWLFSWFRGFIIGLLHKNKLYRFATYTGAKLSRLNVSSDKVELCVEDKKHRLEIYAERKDEGTLHAPYDSKMTERVTESLSSKAEVVLTDKHTKKTILRDKGYCAGLDVNGNLSEIVD